VVFYGYGVSINNVNNWNGIKYFNYQTELLTSKTATTLSNKYGAACAENYSLSDNVYMAGGMTTNSPNSYYSNSVKLDLSTDVSDSISAFAMSMPEGKAKFDMVTDFQYIYMLGGESAPSAPTTDISSYNFLTATASIPTRFADLQINKSIVSQCSKMNSSKTEIIVISNQCVQKINLAAGTVYISTEFNPFDATDGMVCASSHLL
jgi:hypothetical protein